MRDERVRPQIRVRNARGKWKTLKSRSAADHLKMEGKAIVVGDKFELEKGVFAECPGMSGTAKNDCNCRCFLEYKLVTIEEAAKLTGKSEEDIEKIIEKTAGEERETEFVDGGDKRKINDARYDEMFYIVRPEKGDAVKARSIYKDLNKSEVGRETIEYIENNDVSVEINYTNEAPKGIRGQAFGKHIYVYARNIPTIKKIAETIIHETTHIKYDIGGDKKSEVICFLREKLHRNGVLTTKDKRSTIKEVQRLYPKYVWKER